MAACVLCSHILLRMALGVGQSAASQMAEIFITNIPPGFVIFPVKMGPIDRSIFPTALQQMFTHCVLAKQVLAKRLGVSTAPARGLHRSWESWRLWDHK